ncbi:hypothetical protein [Gryllotalpicola protaetiae]|uniref:DUF4352 domain-containing protein n=1 Tax=Gryllotalpicola protaetiae TaxID=2419771 RepID=A0A387C2H8_9MICO|nr:hypothetical protein [Gryllotalpicola protaetiae]AYG04731.1 hypothetical protein D7I44_15150 [Gryllotalpicola protaetiae]
MYTKLAAAAVLSSALMLGLTACGTSGAPSGGPAPATSDAATTPAPTKTAASQNAKFGETYKWSDGLAVTISAPQPFTPSQYAAGVTAGQQNLIFTITINNGTTQNVDAGLSQMTLTSGGTAASSITEIGGPQGDVTGLGPQTPVLPGQSVSWKAAFSVANPADLTSQFSITDFNHKPAIFTS